MLENHILIYSLMLLLHQIILLHFRKSFLGRMMTIDNKIRDEKLRYDINREVAKISALSFEQIDKNEYLTGKKVLPSDKRRVIEQTKFT